MSTIRETVGNVLTQYPTQARPVVEALEAREAEIANALRDIAVEKGLDEDAADEILVTVGLIPAPSPSTTTSVDNTRLAALEAFARRHGFRG